KVVEVRVLVDGFEQGSFKENFILQIFFASERSMKRFLKATRTLDIAGMSKELPLNDRPVIRGAIVGAALAGLVAYGVVQYSGPTATPDQRALIEANNNTIIAIGAEAYGVDPKAFADVIEAVAGKRKKEVVAAAAHILAPAHREPGATVVLGGDAVISNDLVRNMPQHVQFEDEEDFEVSHESALIDIRTTNRDSATRGWRGHIPGMFSERVRLTLGDDVEIKDLAGKLEVLANVRVVYRNRPGKDDPDPVEIIVDSIVPTQSKAGAAAGTP
ncbi:MAG: hypothetical protein Q8K89_04870, partial [Actinomycetota bacterium]|nr:hypothetical protein [Actinomycetota bacterium]